MWKSALAVISLSAVNPNLSAGVYLSITEDQATETFTVNDPYSVIDYQTITPFSAGFSDHHLSIYLKSGYDLKNDSYSFPEPDNKGINAIFFNGPKPLSDGGVFPASIVIYSDITGQSLLGLWGLFPKYDNSANILDSTRNPLGSITFGYSAVPEPSTYLAGLSALGMLGFFGWRNRK